MNHCIIVKFKETVTSEQKLAMEPAIQALFDKTLEIDGISKVTLKRNCIARSNRYDLAIVMEMAEEALPVYDSCIWHKQWKEEYGELLEKKCIFDFE